MKAVCSSEKVNTHYRPWVSPKRLYPLTRHAVVTSHKKCLKLKSHETTCFDYNARHRWDMVENHNWKCKFIFHLLLKVGAEFRQKHLFGGRQSVERRSHLHAWLASNQKDPLKSHIQD